MKRLLLTLLVLVTIVGTAGAKYRKITLRPPDNGQAGVVSFQDSVGIRADSCLVVIPDNVVLDYFAPYCFMAQRYNCAADTLYLRYQPLATANITALRNDTVTSATYKSAVIKMDTMGIGSNPIPIAWRTAAGADSMCDTVMVFKTGSNGSKRGLWYSYVPNRKASICADPFSPPSSGCWKLYYSLGAGDTVGCSNSNPMLMTFTFQYQRKR